MRDVVANIDLSETSVRDLNARLHAVATHTNDKAFSVLNPNGAHAIAAGLTEALYVGIEGHVGYYCAGMNQDAVVEIHGNAGTGVAENIMSGEVRVHGNASQSAGASGHGGLVVIGGDASARCGISMKGVDIVVGGSVGHMSAFMAQAGYLVVCGDAGHDLGDSIYEAVLYIAGKVESLGSDCVEKDMSDAHKKTLTHLLQRAGMDADANGFRRFGSARTLYNFKIDNAGQY
jgi:glutamate synthase domain-containing protein 3